MSDLKDFVIENGVLIKYVGQGGDIIIPDGVRVIGENAFRWCEALKSVVIPNGVTVIGDDAFFNCENLIKIDIPDSVTAIGDGAFFNCKNLIKIDIPDSVTAIGEAAFADCRALKSITIPNAVEKIEKRTFNRCFSLEKVILSNSLKRIDYEAFEYCSSLIEIVLPESIEDIGNRAFWFCNKLSKVIVKCYIKNHKEYGNYLQGAFYNAPDNIILDLRRNSVSIINELSRKALSLICFLENRATGIVYSEEIIKENFSYLKRQRKKLYEYALNSHSLMKYMLNEKIIPLEDAMTLSSNMGAVKNIEIKTMLMAYINMFGANSREKVIEKQEKKIEKELLTDPNSEAGLKLAWNFKKNSDGTITLNSLKQESEVVIVPEKIDKLTVTALNDRCFKDKTGIKEIIIPDTVVKLGQNLFLGCKDIGKVVVGKGVKTIETGTFTESCVKEVVLSKSVKVIEYWAFRRCFELKKISIPQGVEYIGEHAFRECISLEIDMLPKNIKEITAGAFSLCGKVVVQEKAGATYIGTEDNPYYYLYEVDRKIETLKIDDRCKIFAKRVFYSCGKLVEVEIPNGITKIDKDAFANCENLQIVGSAGSYAEEYAKKKKIKFKAL